MEFITTENYYYSARSSRIRGFEPFIGPHDSPGRHTEDGGASWRVPSLSCISHGEGFFWVFQVASPFCILREGVPSCFFMYIVNVVTLPPVLNASGHSHGLLFGYNPLARGLCM